MRYLIPRADDCGSFHEANEAIANACRRGWVLNVGHMVPAPHFREGVEMTREFKHICHGLHLTMTCEWASNRFGPIGKTMARYCEPDGSFPSDPLRIHHAPAVLDEMVAEVHEQLRYARACGLHIEYMDAHMGISWIHEPDAPQRRLEQCLREICDKEGIVWFADRHEPAYAALGESDDTIADLRGRKGNVVFVTHPALAQGGIAADHTRGGNDQPGAVARERQRDYERLLDRELERRIRDLGYVMAKYTEAPAAGPSSAPA